MRHDDCPHPLARAPLHAATRTALLPVPPALAGLVSAAIVRDTTAAALTPAQRLIHFPASAWASLTWFVQGECGLCEGEGQWTPFGSAIVFSGPQPRPTVMWSPGGGQGLMLALAPDALHALFGLDPGAWLGRIVPAEQVFARAEWPWLHAVLQAPGDAQRLALLEAELGLRWQAARRAAFGRWGGAQMRVRAWVDGVALRARTEAAHLSQRQQERRIRAACGRSLRELQRYARAEDVFLRTKALDAAHAFPPLAALAHDMGFADQAHMTREVKRVTGFAPATLRERIAADEAFWLYRVWV